MVPQVLAFLLSLVNKGGWDTCSGYASTATSTASTRDLCAHALSGPGPSSAHTDTFATHSRTSCAYSGSMTRTLKQLDTNSPHTRRSPEKHDAENKDPHRKIRKRVVSARKPTYVRPKLEESLHEAGTGILCNTLDLSSAFLPVSHVDLELRVHLI